MKTKIATALASGLACLLAGTFTASAVGPNIISESFNSGTLPGTLEITGISVNFSGGAALFGGATYSDRSYLRTIAADFYSRSFVAEVTVTTGSDITFFGMGEGAPGSFYSEPNLPSLNLRFHPNSAVGGRLDVADNDSGFNATIIRDAYPGNGTHRLQLTWDATAKTAVFAIQQNYAGGPFVPDFTLSAFNGADNGFTDSNTRIFFGSSAQNEWESSRPASFDDLSIIVVPEPTGGLLLVVGLGVFGRWHRFRKNSALKLFSER